MEFNIYIGVAFGIIFLGFMIALFLALRGYGKAKGIKHYEKIRDELTVREEEPESEPKSEGGGFNLGSLIGGFVTICIGVSLVPIIADEVNNAQVNLAQPLAPLTQTLLNLVPAFFAFGVIAVAIFIIWNSVRDIGLV